MFWPLTEHNEPYVPYIQGESRKPDSFEMQISRTKCNLPSISDQICKVCCQQSKFNVASLGKLANEADHLFDPKILSAWTHPRQATFEQDSNTLIFRDADEIFSYRKFLNSTFNTIILRATVNSRCIKYL